MKKFFFFLFVAVAFAACDKGTELVVEFADLQKAEVQNKVSLKDALLYAENCVNGINPSTRSVERKVKSTEVYVAKPVTRSAEDVEVSFYLINYEDNEGFAMVSTDSRTTALYAYSEKGNLTTEDLENNPALRIFIDGSIEQYQLEIASYEDGSGRLPIELPDSSYEDIIRLPIVEYDGDYYYERRSTDIINKGALLTTYWHQRAPYGSLCPNGVAGCGPVAAAQIMAYYQYPVQRLWHIYDWNAMTATSTLNSNSQGASSAAQLIRDIGSEADAEYNEYEDPMDNTTSTRIGNMKDAFRSFGYNCGHPTSYDVNRVQENINAERPIYIRGENGKGGHAWVIDGYQYRGNRVTYYYTYEPYARYDTFIESALSYFHCNLGWGETNNEQAQNNGYYYAYSFIHNDELKVIYDIIPNE